MWTQAAEEKRSKGLNERCGLFCADRKCRLQRRGIKYTEEMYFSENRGMESFCHMFKFSSESGACIRTVDGVICSRKHKRISHGTLLIL